MVVDKFHHCVTALLEGQTCSKLANDLTNIITILENQDLLHLDAALISRLLYRTKKLLRNDKGYKGFQKVYHILKNYLSLNIVSVVSENRFASYNGKGPSKEMLEWCLISFQRFAALFFRLEKTCTETAYYLHNHITTGNRWHLALLFLACLSRVWTLSRYLLILVCEWYSQLKSYLNCLESEDHWLPFNYQLPDDLQSWLGNPVFLLKPNRKDALVNESMTPKVMEQTNICRGLLFNEDFGEIVTRNSDLVPNSASENTKRIRNPEDIETLLRKEEICRKKNTKSLSKNADDEEWNYIRNDLKRSLKKITTVKDQNIFCESINRAHIKMKSWLDNDV